jgi:hypothetical protein
LRRLEQEARRDGRILEIRSAEGRDGLQGTQNFKIAIALTIVIVFVDAFITKIFPVTFAVTSN